jgi:hypothetical protein
MHTGGFAFSKVKVKQSLYKPGQALRFAGAPPCDPQIIIIIIIITIIIIIVRNCKKFPKLHMRPPSLILLMIHPRIDEYFPAKAEK